MANRLKVLTIVGTRPEIIKLSRVLFELDQCTDHVLVHTGQNYDYELNEIFFEELQIKRPSHFLEVAGGNAAETIARVIAKSDEVFAQEKPDALLLYGDTNSCLSAIAAKRRKIPVFHMEAGNRCFDERVPEEINRRIIDHISDINMPLTEHARRYLIAEGLRPETVIKTGSTMYEILNHFRPKYENSTVLEQLGLKSREYLIVSCHREENVDDPSRLGELLLTLNLLAEKYSHPIIFSAHPRTRKRLEELQNANATRLNPLIRTEKPFGFFDYIKLQSEAKCVLSDSGTLSEESSLLDFPAVMLRDTHERPEGMDEATLIMCGLRHARVLQAVETVVSHSDSGQRVFRAVQDYEAPVVSKKVVRIILSYVDFVNRTVWHKQE